ncbi:MAG: NAD(+)/NADH kinase [Rhodospirillaceae bacterium]|nr:NAD(+)/NADH kinase [Rhodospirillaceae bacterium]
MARKPLSGSAVGIIANPAAGRDIRRLVAQASVFPIAEKRNMITRIFSALGAVGVSTCYMIPDESGIADRVKRAIDHGPPVGQVWPEVEFLDMPIEGTPADTLEATARMVERGVGGIVVLGGDGTNRLVAQACDGVPLTSLSTGTNNVFPMMREATIAGLAAGMVATGALTREEAARRNKVLRVTIDGTPRDIALVDVCVSGETWTGAKALWRADALDQLFVTFAEADAIGLSSIAGLVRPVSRDDPTGVAIDLAAAPGAARTVSAPLAPGLMAEIGVERVADLEAGVPHPIRLERGVVALDGEREIAFGPNERVAVVLQPDGPLTVEIARAMALAAQSGLLEQSAAADPSA